MAYCLKKLFLKNLRMRYLIYSSCYAVPHFETELEVATMLIKEGHDVFFLVCDAELKTCFINPDHKMSVCYACQSKISNGLKMLHIPKERILRLSQFKIDDIVCDYSFASVSELKKFTYKGSDIGLAVSSSIISSIRDHKFDTAEYKKRIKTGLVTAIMMHEKGEQILDAIKPDTVIMFNGRFLELRPIMRLCEKRGIEYYTHERGGQIDRYMLRKNSTPHAISFAKAEIEQFWLNGGPEKYTIGKNFFLNRRNKIIQSWSVFTAEQKDGVLPEGFDPAKKNIAIFNSSMDEYEGIADFNNPIYDDDNDGIERICESFINDENYHFYLRVHPNLKGLNNAQNKAIAKIAARYSNITVIAPEAIIDSYALMEAVDTVITFGSTMGIEAMFWNRPSLLVGKAFYQSLEGIVQPKSHEEVIHFITHIPTVVANESAIKFGYWCSTFGTKFKYYEAEGLFSGKFMGEAINPSIISRVKIKISKLLEGN